jgi:hypothetical protein
MIIVYVTQDGYFVQGEGVEACLRCSPALDDRGNAIFNEIHHTYKVIYMALKEVARKDAIQGDVVVYNDSRIIDELNNVARPMDEVCERWQKCIRREIIPSIRSIVIFRKKAANFIRERVATGQNMLAAPDPAILARAATKIEELDRQMIKSMKNRVVDRFRRMWKHE